MVQPDSVSNREQVVDTMIGLTRLTSLHRTIVAGSGGMELYLALRRRWLPSDSHRRKLPNSERTAFR